MIIKSDYNLIFNLIDEPILNNLPAIACTIPSTSKSHLDQQSATLSNFAVSKSKN